MALLKDGTRIYGTLFANTEVVIGSMNVASQINASFLQANSANILAQAAFNTANTASANTIYTQGVDATQNTRITSVENLVTSSYAHANAAFNQANVGATFVNTGGTVSGNVTFTKDVSVTGNLYVLGNTVSVNTSSFSVQDSLIVLGVGNYTTDLLDIGFAGHYNDGTNAHAGLIRDASEKEFYIFQGYTPELSASNNVDINDPSFSKANLNAQVFKGNLIGSTAVVNGIELYNYTTGGFAKANTVGALAQDSFDAANTAAANTVYGQGVNLTQNTNITSVNTFAGSAYDRANNSLALTGGTIAGDITANNFTANISIHTPNIYSPSNGALIEMSDIGIISINPSGGSGAGVKFVGKSIEINKAYGGSYGGNFLSVENETKLVSNRYDSVKIVTGIDGVESNNWNFANNQLIFPDNTYQNTAFTGTGIDQYARDTANTSSANTVYTQGVDATQNTNITSINSYVSGAYNKANTADVKAQAAFDAANTGGGGGTLDQYARDTANTSSANTIYTQGVDATQNTSITFLNVYTQAAFDKANTGGGGGSGEDQYARDTANSKTYTFYQNTAPATSNAHDLWVNSNTGVVYENFGNTTTPIWAEFGPTPISNTSNVYINTLDRLSNLTSSLILNNNGSLTFNDNTVQTTAYTGFGIDNVARTTANTANNLSQSTSVLAQAAFDTANTAVSSTIGKSIAMAIVFGG